MDPWYKGDYSRHIREVPMVVERLPEVNRPSGRVPGQDRLAAPILESRQRRNRGRYREKGSASRVFGTRGKYRRKGGTRAWTLPPDALLVRPGARPPGWALDPLWSFFSDSVSLLNTDFLYIFPGIFGAL